MENIFSKFTNKYSLSKTLRFELKPVGKTKQNIESAGFLESDEKMSDEYVEIKKIIDRYHKAFIERVFIFSLSKCHIK
jgi:CRISPR-associated protein Cpf1